MQRIKNIVLEGYNKLPILSDIFFNDSPGKKDIIIYSHGFNGFKDWGNFDLIAEKMARAGFAFIKFNFSHNGTDIHNPEEFTNLEAFGNNNFSIELGDLNKVIDWAVSEQNPYHANLNTQKVFLIGHSMGGGISILQTARDNRISGLITWASISECKTPWGEWPQDKMEQWKRDGVAYYHNGRTGQEMPLYYQLFEDYRQNEEQLNIEKAIRKIHVPVLICHGTNDPAVKIEKANLLKDWQPKAILYTLDTDHVFGRKHPWMMDTLPEAMEKVLEESIQFLLAID